MNFPTKGAPPLIEPSNARMIDVHVADIHCHVLLFNEPGYDPDVAKTAESLQQGFVHVGKNACHLIADDQGDLPPMIAEQWLRSFS